MKYQCFVDECRILVRKLVKQGYKNYVMKTYCDKLSGLYQSLYNKDSISVKADIFDE